MAILTSKGVKAPHQLRGVRKVRISRDRRGSGDVSSIENRIDTLEDDVDTITDLVPSDASASNKLVTEKDIHNLEKFTGNLNNLFGYRKPYTCAHYYAMPNDITANAPTVSGMSVSVYYIDVWKDANGFIFQMVRAVGVASNTGVNQTFVRSRFDDGFYPVWGAWQKLVTESDISYLSKDKIVYHQETSVDLLSLVSQFWQLETNKAYIVQVVAADKNSPADNWFGIIKFTYDGVASITNIATYKLGGTGTVDATNNYGTVQFSFVNGLPEVAVTFMG